MKRKSDSSYRHVRGSLDRKGFTSVSVREFRGSVLLEGEVSTWDKKISAGYTAAGKGYRHVINDIRVEGINEETFFPAPSKDCSLEGAYYDVTVIGGGIIGSAAAREITKTNLSVCMIEKEEDLAMHASGRNDGMIHPGFAASPGSKKALYNVRGNKAYTDICRDLDIPMQRPGSLILYRGPGMLLLTPVFYYRSRKNGVEGAGYLSRKKILEAEPFITRRQAGGFFFPTAGILSPYKLTIAFAENAVCNGCSVFLDTSVQGFSMEGPGRITAVKTNRGTFRTGIVINAAGIWADAVAGFAGDRYFSLHGRKGVDALLDLKTGQFQRRIAALVGMRQLNSHTKGGGIVPTVEGNILVGPTAAEVPFRENYATTGDDLGDLLKRLEVNTMLHTGDVITYFAGIRACTYEEDFIIERSPTVENLIHLAGIQSPGLASAPAIAEDAAALCAEAAARLVKEVKPNPSFNPKRTSSPSPVRLSLEERAELVRRDPAYGRIVCRCEEISEGEIRDALRSPVPAATLDGIKRRTRGGMGRCQGGFCTPRIMEIMHEISGVKLGEITKKGRGSQVLGEETKSVPAETSEAVESAAGGGKESGT